MTAVWRDLLPLTQEGLQHQQKEVPLSMSGDQQQVQCEQKPHFKKVFKKHIDMLLSGSLKIQYHKF